MARYPETTRTQMAVRKWSDTPGNIPILLDTKLADLRDNALLDLLDKINDEFHNERGFPISPEEWRNLNPKTVREIRDEVRRRSGADR